MIKDVLPYFLSVISILIAIYIAVRQNKQIKKQNDDIEQTKDISDKTKVISDETKSISSETLKINNDIKQIAESLATDEYIKERGEKLLSLELDRKRKGQNIIALPVKYEGKPLPVIEQGDFYATQVLTLALGLDDIEICEVDRGGSKYKIEYGNIIYICSPQTNPALNDKIPYGIIDSNNVVIGYDDNADKNVLCNDDKQTKDWLKSIKLPCWFISDYDDKMAKDGHPVKKIQIFDLDDYNKDDNVKQLRDPLASRAEPWYQQAKGNNVKIEVPTVEDYGILARLSEPEGRIIIIAGIHQYGTWIVSEFLNRVLRNKCKNKSFIKIFERGNDFISIITGEFNGRTLKVGFTDIDRYNLWEKKDNNRWWRYDRIIE